jgi:hypothetical protein
MTKINKIKYKTVKINNAFDIFNYFYINLHNNII